MDTKFVVYKYVLSADPEQTLQIPRSFRPLQCLLQMQSDGSPAICVWGLCMVGDPTEERQVRVLKTGEEIDGDFLDRFEFLETIQLALLEKIPGEEIRPKNIVSHIWIERAMKN